MLLKTFKKAKPPDCTTDFKPSTPKLPTDDALITVNLKTSNSRSIISFGMSAKLKARAEIPLREWVEFEIWVGADGKIEKSIWRALGCHDLLAASAQAAQA